MLNRASIIQSFIDKYQYQTYLEIGINDPKYNFDLINCTYKTGVDPNVEESSYSYPHIGFKQTSDEFFSSLTSNKKFDIIFIDGLHTLNQIQRDVFNSLMYLSSHGTIVLHDCNPHSEICEQDSRMGKGWRVIYELRKTRADLNTYVINMVLGCGIIRKEPQTNPPSIVNTEPLDYRFLERYRKDVLNLIEKKDFIESFSYPIAKIKQSDILDNYVR